MFIFTLIFTYLLLSGFSKFSSAMCAKGASGLDDLHSATNEFLGHFVDVVYEYRGDGEELILNTETDSRYCHNYYP